jgi:rare lipoprotein A
MHSPLLRCLIAFLFGVLIVGCGASVPRFTSKEKRTVELASSQLSGIASYYADEFHGRKTANGETYDMHELTAAHRTLPFNTKLKVRNLENNKEVVVRVNDRGPFKDDRVIDLSLEAAKLLGLIAKGTAPVELDIVEPGSQIQ